MELALQVNSKDHIVRIDTEQDLKDFNSQSPTTQAKKGEQLFSMMPAMEKTSDLIRNDNDIVKIST